MRMRYREEKATQAAARLLWRRGGAMSHLKLIELLYLVDREAFVRFGRPVTYDSYASMPHGPVLSSTLDRIDDAEYYRGGYWDRHIAPKQNHEVALRGPAPNDQLSRAEEELIDEIFEKYGRMERWELVEFTHTLPEWHEPQGSRRPIDPADILRDAGYSEDDIRDIAADLDEVALAESLFG
jgi:uncharacterized phage-associated protein